MWYLFGVCWGIVWSWFCMKPFYYTPQDTPVTPLSHPCHTHVTPLSHPCHTHVTYLSQVMSFVCGKAYQKHKLWVTTSIWYVRNIGCCQLYSYICCLMPLGVASYIMFHNEITSTDTRQNFRYGTLLLGDIIVCWWGAMLVVHGSQHTTANHAAQGSQHIAYSIPHDISLVGLISMLLHGAGVWSC